MGISRARGVALLSTVALVASLVAVVGASAPATAGSLSAPSVNVRQASSDTVTVTGRTAKRKAKVRIHKRTASGWKFVKRVKARKYRYRATLRVAAGTTKKFRVTSYSTSRTFTVKSPKPKPTQYDACGARPRKADGSLWACTFVDEFAGTELDRTKWVPNTAFVTWSGTTPACYRDDPANVNVTNGVLNLSLVELETPEACGVIGVSPTRYMAGSVSTYHLFSQQYGRFEARIKTEATNAPGLHEAFWLWPDNRYSTINWPDSGEIDVAESFSKYPTTVGSYLHYSADHVGLLYGVNAANCTANRGEWNTFTVDWGPSRIQTYINGTPCLTNTSADPAFQKAYIINLTQAIGGATWNQLGDATPVPATMQVDYVHAWK